MRRLPLPFLLAILSLTTGLRAEEEGIRPFPIPVIEQLGKELFRRDEMAARAFDLLFESHPESKQAPIRGWVTEYNKERRFVYFIQERDSKLSLAYSIDFQKQDAPKIEDRAGIPLPEAVARRFSARKTAIDAIPNFMTKTYNFEVLDDPEGQGFLVYALAATKDPHEIVVGGHYRVTVSSDGKTAQRVDALSRSFLVLKKSTPDMPKGSEIKELMMSHIVSSTPVETHVYLNLLHQIPFLVITSESDQWEVSAGRISKVVAPK
jgi:hypothetical protein